MEKVQQTSMYLYYGSLYFVMVGVLYLWGYWLSFGVNILEYLSLSDVLKSTAYPIASTFVFFVIGVAQGHFSATRDVLPEGGGQATGIGKFLINNSRALIKLYFIGVIALLLFGPVQKWVIVPILIAIPVALLVKRLGFFESFIPNGNSRTTFLFLVAALPPFSYGIGRIESATILEGKKYSYVTSQIEGVFVSDDREPEKRLKFLGHAGEFIFLLHPDNTLIISKFEQAKFLQIREFKEPHRSLYSWLISNSGVEKSSEQANKPPAAAHTKQ